MRLSKKAQNYLSDIAVDGSKKNFHPTRTQYDGGRNMTSWDPIENQDFSEKITKTCSKIFFPNTCLVILGVLPMLKISIRSVVPSSRSRNGQKKRERVPLNEYIYRSFKTNFWMSIRFKLTTFLACCNFFKISIPLRYWR